ncbi:MAG: CRTAC1 family protein [Terriglobales bacterium]
MNRRQFTAAAWAGVAGAALAPRWLWGGEGLRRAPEARGAQTGGRREDYILPRFSLVQPELFAQAGGQPNGWADYNNDGRPDLFVGFMRDIPNRLYRNDEGRFSEVAAEVGLADTTDTRAASWGDFDRDGHLDLYVGFTRRSGARNKLYRNEGEGKHFTDVAHELGVDAMGESRQVSWIDFDNDGRVDLFVAFRDAPNRLFHNEGNRFVDVAPDMGVADPRKTVGAVWFDYNRDGRLDLYVANEDGTLNGLFRNDGHRFVDVAEELGMTAAGRARDEGSNGPSVMDYDNDGLLDLFVASYGPNFLYHSDGRGRFTEVAAAMGVRGGDQATPSNWGDYDNDGRADLYVSNYLLHPLNEHDHLYHNAGDHFSDAIAPMMLGHGATHGVQWADYDGDGALDLALCNNNPHGHHYLWHNDLPPERARRSLQVLVTDARGRYTKAGSEVRVYQPGTRTLVGTRLVDTGSGYCSQNVMPVHLGLPTEGPLDVEVTSMSTAGRKITRVAGVDPNQLPRRVLKVAVP